MSFVLKDFHQKLRNALFDMAEGKGSISERLSCAYTDYFASIHWREISNIMPESCQSSFGELHKLLQTDLLANIEKERQQFVNKDIVTSEWVIRHYHWQTTRKIIRQIRELYSNIDFELTFNQKNKIL